MKIKILMVCLGNICRSPLAEGILQSMVDNNKVLVDSAGTGAWHVGEKPDPRSIETARRHGIDITEQRARQFVAADFDRFDCIYAMDANNMRDILRLATDDTDRQKVKLLLPENTNTPTREVPDPYYGGDEGFETVFQLLDKACACVADTFSRK